MAPHLEASPSAYVPRDPRETILYQVVAAHLETFLATVAADPTAIGLPAYVVDEFYAYLQCGILAHGFLRLGCDSCQKEVLLAFSCKRRAFCPSCAGRRMAQTAAHLVEAVMPWVPTRQWVVSVPMPLRYWTAPSRDLTAQVHGIIRTTIAQFYVNQAVKRGAKRHNVQPGSVTFLQRFGGALQLNLHYHVIVIEGVFLDRTDQGLKPRLLKGEPPSDADVAHVVQKISRRVIRTLRRLGYLEAGMEVPVATGYDPLRDTEPELARTMAASVKQRIAFGERAGQKVRRIGSGFGYEGERPELTGPRCASVNGFSLHANTAIPAHRRDQLERLIRYTARGALSLERLAQDTNGDLIYRFNRPWSDGTTGIKLSPLELLEKLAALVPLPRIAEEEAHPASLVWASYGLGCLSLHQGDLPRALPLLERAVSLCQDVDLPGFFPEIAATLGAAYTLGGRVADAVPLLTQAMEQTMATEVVAWYQAFCRLVLGEAHMLAGRLEEAHTLAEQALGLAREHQERGNQAYALRLLGDIAVHREPPEVEAAETHYRQALTMAEELGMRPLQAHCHHGLGKLYRHTGRVEPACAELSATIDLYRSMDMTFWLPEAEAALARVEGQ